MRMAALRECESEGLAPSDEARRRAADRLRRRLGLFGRGTLDRWLAENDLTPASFGRLIDEEARIEELEALARARADAHLLDDLRVRGDYARYAARARAKRLTLAGADAAEEQLDERTKFQLTLWYFEKRLGVPVPDDIAKHAVDIGFSDAASFYRALRHEWIHVTRGDGPDSIPRDREE
jgi:hypothetical protein